MVTFPAHNKALEEVVYVSDVPMAFTHRSRDVTPVSPIAIIDALADSQVEVVKIGKASWLEGRWRNWVIDRVKKNLVVELDGQGWGMRNMSDEDVRARS